MEKRWAMAEVSGFDKVEFEGFWASGIKPRSLQAVLGGSLGHIVEWFDWTIYATLAAVFSKQFFPSDDPTVSVLAAFGAFAGGYAMRPVGALVLSPISVPIVYAGECLGALNLNHREHYYSREHVEMIETLAPVLIPVLIDTPHRLRIDDEYRTNAAHCRGPHRGRTLQDCCERLAAPSGHDDRATARLGEE
jgi:hypothetical protein